MLNHVERVSSSCGELKALIDSGAGSNFITKEKANGFKLKMKGLPKPIEIRVADGTTHGVNDYVSMEILGRNVDLLVAPLKNKVDVILGYPWMKDNKAQFDYDNGRLKVERTPEDVTGDDIQEQDPSEGLKDMIISEKQFNKMMKKNQVLEACIVETRVRGTTVLSSSTSDATLLDVNDSDATFNDVEVPWGNTDKCHAGPHIDCEAEDEFKHA